MSPELALRRVMAGGAITPTLVGRTRSQVIHVASCYGRQRNQPLCGQHSRRWRTPAHPYRRRLCTRCDRLVDQHTEPVTLTPYILAVELAAARTEVEVVALRRAVIAAGPLSVAIGNNLHGHYADALYRIRRAAA